MRYNISPSDLTWKFTTGFACNRCLWLKYNHSIRTPTSDLQLFSDLAEHQERAYLGKSYSECGISGWGEIVSQGEQLTSATLPVKAKGEWYIQGKYDLLGLNIEGTYAIFDCKLQGKLKDKSDVYAPQLNAYRYAFENPSEGEGFAVTRLALLAWTPIGVKGNLVTKQFGLGMTSEVYPVKSDTDEFLRLIQRFVKVMEGDEPESGKSCKECQYVDERTLVVSQNHG